MQRLALLCYVLLLRQYVSCSAERGLRAMEQISSNIFDFFPDRDHLDIFSMRIPREAVSPREADSINVKIKNDQGYTCAEKTGVRELEIRGLPCDQCMQGRLHITIEPRNQSQILSRAETIVLDESRRAEICNLRPERRRQGENITITTVKRRQEDGCRWLFRGGHIGCCYSNRNFYKQSGGCNPFMQSPACREGSEIPIIKEEANSCTLHISNLDVKDSGNYLLSNDDRGTPIFKINLVVNVRPKIVTGPRNITAPLGQKLLELECGIQAASGDDPEVIWWKDGAELGEFGFQNEKFGLQNEKRMRLAKNNNSLLIYNISSTDQGNYTCVLKVGALEIDSQTGQVAVIDIQDTNEWKGICLVGLALLGTALLILPWIILSILLRRAHRLRQSNTLYINGNNTVDSSREEETGEPLRSGSGEDEGEERKNVEKGKLEKWLKKLVRALFPDIGLRKQGCLLERCKGTDDHF